MTPKAGRVRGRRIHLSIKKSEFSSDVTLLRSWAGRVVNSASAHASLHSQAPGGLGDPPIGGGLWRALVVRLAVGTETPG